MDDVSKAFLYTIDQENKVMTNLISLALDLLFSSGLGIINCNQHLSGK